jgi:hypothetical protein
VTRVLNVTMGGTHGRREQGHIKSLLYVFMLLHIVLRCKYPRQISKMDDAQLEISILIGFAVAVSTLPNLDPNVRVLRNCAITV